MSTASEMWKGHRAFRRSVRRVKWPMARKLYGGMMIGVVAIATAVVCFNQLPDWQQNGAHHGRALASTSPTDVVESAGRRALTPNANCPTGATALTETCAGTTGFKDLDADAGTYCAAATCAKSDFADGGSCCPTDSVTGFKAEPRDINSAGECGSIPYVVETLKPWRYFFQFITSVTGHLEATATITITSNTALFTKAGAITPVTVEGSPPVTGMHAMSTADLELKKHANCKATATVDATLKILTITLADDGAKDCRIHGGAFVDVILGDNTMASATIFAAHPSANTKVTFSVVTSADNVLADQLGYTTGGPGGHGTCNTADMFAYTDRKVKGAFLGVVYLLICLYVFIGVGILCDYFFEPSLEAISEALSLSPDVAGATFMAAGSSAPELFTSVADTFGTSNNIGIGTIVGSAMFNILIIIALSAMYAGQTLEIDWVPVARDVAFYSGSVALLCIFFLSDDWIEWWEGAAMVFGYVVYIVYMMFNEKIHDKCRPPRVIEEVKKGKLQRSMTRAVKKKEDKDAGIKPEKKMLSRSHSRTVKLYLGDKNKGSKVSPATGAPVPKEAFTEGASQQSSPSESAAEEPEEEEESLWEWPDSKAGQFMFILSVPFNLMFTITIPDCSKAKFEKLYPVTFLMCILWLAALCAVMATFGTAIGCIWGISPLVMGILLLSIGTSVPDAMASMIVAKGGEGGMAIANAIGSNVFDILLGLGLPWMVYGLLDCDFPTADGKCVIHRNKEGNLYLDLFILYLTVALFVVAMVVNKWKMDMKLAYMLIGLYAAYITYQLFQASSGAECAAH